MIHFHARTGDKLPCFRHFADFVRRSGLNPENSCSGFQHRGGDFTHPRDIARKNIEISHATPSHPHLLIGGMYPYMPRGGARFKSTIFSIDSTIIPKNLCFVNNVYAGFLCYNQNMIKHEGLGSEEVDQNPSNLEDMPPIDRLKYRKI